MLLAAAAACARPLSAQLPASVDYHDYPACLPNYLRALAKTAYDRRIRALAAVTSADAVRQRQRWAVESFWKVAGAPAARTPLNLRTTGSFQRPKYRVENVLYESRPGMVIAANLYLPAGAGPFPGVLFHMGHSPNGKAADTYQRCCQGLAQLGYVVLAFDPMGQGERTNYPGPNGLTRLPSTDDEHTVPGRQMLLTGATATNWQVWDAVRSLDVLLRMPETTEAFGDDIVFELRGILTEEFGSNLRNLMAHGLLMDGECYAPAIEYLWWLLLRLCVIPLQYTQDASADEVPSE